MFNKIKKQAIPGSAVHTDKHTLRLILASTLLMVPAVQAAEDTLTVTAETQESVTAPTKGIVAKESASGTKTATPLRKTPQTISVVTREQMNDQQPASVADALGYSSGVVTNYRGNSNRNDEVISRGFRYAPKLLDGLHYGLSSENGGAGQLDPWLLERVEMVHGPAGVLYGQVSPGGLLMMTSKRPTAESIHEVKLSTGNRHYGEAAFDFGGKLNDDNTLFYRLNGIANTKSEFVKNSKQQRMAIAPAITWLPNEDTSFTLLTSYQNDPKAGSRNFLPRSGTLYATPEGFTVPYDLNVSDSDFAKSKREQTSIGYSLDHSFNEAVSFTQNLRYSHRNEDYKYLVYGYDYSDHVMTRMPQHEETQTNEFNVDNQLKGLFETGDVSHTVLGGLDYRYSHIDLKLSRAYGTQYNLDWTNPGRIDIDENDLALATSTLKTLNQYGVYLQDQMAWNNWNLVLSGREDWSQVRTQDRLANTDVTYNDSAFTGRAGLLYAFDNGVSPYISYSTSFEPVLAQPAPGSDPLKPTTGAQTEVGVKFQPVGSNTMMTVSWFDINQKNVLSSIDGTRYYNQIGKVNSQGIETEIHAQPTPEIKLIAAYTYTDATTKESDTAAEVGHSPAAIPRHAASAWGSYSFLDGALDGLTVGTGVRYVGKAGGDNTGEYYVPHYTLYDAMVKYELGQAVPALKGTSLQFNVQNLTDEHYVASCSNAYACFYGSGRTFVASVDYRW
ncbi:TonB-dependent siderophore receptor [Erwinia aphidicola]|jgi:iron complex outermembrane receptor protein|uniref:TonB-dependent siderophore receptor n=2 Tax=Erwinia TaxID=551 RepID=UPI0006721665|nr:ferrichrysobactin receptor [bacteria symbiont BFo1 of Frankliniella occidentalis]MBN1086288.1 TonB-dependent siderophore receptor [Erwinia aphidicola]CAH0228861.1 Ferrichrome-iron receptor [Erwinia aphidicola]